MAEQWYRIVPSGEHTPTYDELLKGINIEECKFCGKYTSDPDTARFLYHTVELLTPDEIVIMSLDGAFALGSEQVDWRQSG